MSIAHRMTQVAAHLAAVARERLCAPLGAAQAGAAGSQRLVELGANDALQELFARAHPADRAAATRLASALRRAGGEADEEIAALLHDTAKGRAGLGARIIHVLEGSPIGGDPGGPLASERRRLRHHATSVVDLARDAGAPRRCVEILTELARLEADRNVRHQGDVVSQGEGHGNDAALRLYLLDSGGRA